MIIIFSSALFIPTLVESFGLIYIEAMKYNCPILTSDRDFAHWICKDLAMYFDPLNEMSIVDIFEKFVNGSHFLDFEKKVTDRLKLLPESWEEVSLEYIEIFKKLS